MDKCPCCGSVITGPVESQEDVQRWFKARLEVTRLLRDSYPTRASDVICGKN